ncbi:MAG: hypothetical protein FWH20_02795 [Oscillospiraceae bacterium]|nr:hypothetical protein [Oscillospiraceae bacterium]
MRKFISVIITIAILAAMVTAIPLTATATYELDPIPSDSIPISTRAELEARVAGNRNGKFHLTQNIDLGTSPWTPMFTAASPFNGTLDGRGYIISRLSIVGDHEYAGLFGGASDTAVIKNLGVTGVISVASSATTNRETSVGGIVGTGGNIENCFSNVNISVNVQGVSKVGGIAGSNATVRNCFNTGNITIGSATVEATRTRGDKHAGGIGGHSVYVSDSFNIGAVSVFGISLVSISNALSSLYIGGIVGNNFSVGYSYNSGDVLGAMYAGTNTTTNGTIYLGALAGQVSAQNSYWNIQSSQTFRGTPRNELQKQAFESGIAIETSSLTPAEMRQKGNFRNWDFDNTWTYMETINDGFPVLQSLEIFIPNIEKVIPELLVIGEICVNCARLVRDCICFACGVNGVACGLRVCNICKPVCGVGNYECGLIECPLCIKNKIPPKTGLGDYRGLTAIAIALTATSAGLWVYTRRKRI